MSLNTQGIISAVTLAIYVPIFILAIRICSRYGIRERGWLLLVIFSLIRIIGGSLLVAAEIVQTSEGLYIGGYALEASGLSPLLLSTLGLIEIIMENHTGEQEHALKLRILHIVGMIALVLMILGLTDTSSTNTSNTERRVGVLLFVALYVCLIALTLFQWARRNSIMKYRKQLLAAVTAALPFLAVRTLYSVLSTFSSSDSSLAEFNLYTGKWQVYVVMEVLMEYIIVLIYVAAGNVLRLDQDYKLQESDEYPLYAPPQY